MTAPIADDERVTIRDCARNTTNGNGAACPRYILDEDRLTE
jgi:hypothetical protein